jgi:hypothetical protein
MNIALCYYGQLRTFRYCFQNHFETFINPLGIKDIFCHFWWSYSEKQLYGAPWSKQETDHINRTSIQDVQDVISIYNPKHLSYTDPLEPKIFNLDKIYSTNSVEYNNLSDKDKKYSGLFGYYSAFNSIKNVSQALENYERTNNVRYDWIILTRYDMLMMDKIDKNIFSKNKRGYYWWDVLFLFKREDFYTWAKQVEFFYENLESFKENHITPEMMQLKYAKDYLDITNEHDFECNKLRHLFHRGNSIKH